MYAGAWTERKPVCGQDDIRMDLGDKLCDHVDCIHLFQNSDSVCEYDNKHLVSIRGGDFRLLITVGLLASQETSTVKAM